MLAGRSVVMAGAILRGDLHRKIDRPAEGEKGGPITAINIGRYAQPSPVDVVGNLRTECSL